MLRSSSATAPPEITRLPQALDMDLAPVRCIALSMWITDLKGVDGCLRCEAVSALTRIHCNYGLRTMTSRGPAASMGAKMGLGSNGTLRLTVTECLS